MWRLLVAPPSVQVVPLQYYLYSSSILVVSSSTACGDTKLGQGAIGNTVTVCIYVCIYVYDGGISHERTSSPSQVGGAS